MLITNKGQMVRTRVKEIRAVGRNTMGVKLMDLRGAEKLQAIAPVVSQESAEVEADSDPDAGGVKKRDTPARVPFLIVLSLEASLVAAPNESLSARRWSKCRRGSPLDRF